VQIALLDFSFSLSSALFIVVYVSFFSVFSVFFLNGSIYQFALAP
jgi:hypothetical protein